VIPTAAVIAASTAVGVAVEHRFGAAATRVAGRLMSTVLWFGLPVAIFFNLAALEFTAGIGLGIVFAYGAAAATVGLAYAVGTWLLRLPRPAVGALMCVSLLGNTGYLGLPFNAALFGFDHIGTAVVYDVLVSTMLLITVGFSIGAAFGTVAERPRERFRAFWTRNPPIWAAAAGLLAPDVLAPGWAVDASRLLVFAILPIGFFVVGVTLSREAEEGAAKFPPPFDAPVVAAVALKLAVMPATLLALAALLRDVPDTYPVQAAMCSGINTILIADEYGLDRGLTAAVIAWTTTIVVVVGLGVALL
jgi:malate permease and related proteins